VLDDFPTTASYLAALPSGLASHRDAFGFDVHEGARRQVLEQVPTSELRASFGEVFFAGWEERWTPEVPGLTAQLLLFDTLGEADYLRWIYADAYRLYDRPVVRHLMRLLSPSLVVMGAASRWGALHRGSTLHAMPLQKGPRRMTGGAELRFPAGLFPAAFCRGLGASFRAALDLAHASSASVELVEHDHQRAIFEIGWDR
jgi:hypothetical protein